MDPAQNALITQLTAPGSMSKKYRMTVIGLAVVLLIYLSAAAAFICNPLTMGPLLAFANSTSPIIGGMVAVFAGAQAAVDYRSTASLASRSMTP